MKTFILADRQDITRKGILFLIEQYGITKKIEEIRAQAELEKILINTPDAVIVTDFHYSDFLNENTLIQLHQRFPYAHWVIFSENITDELLYQYCANPSFSFVLKDCEMNEISAALTYAAKGENFICNPITRMLLHYRRETLNEDKEHLTATEKEILKLIALGKSAKEIAYERNSSVYTIVTHKKNLFKKLNVNNIHDATKYALKAGLVDTIEYYI